MPMGGCHQEYILTIDEVPTTTPLVSSGNSYPNSGGTGANPAGNENLFVPFNLDITVQPGPTYIPNNTIHMLPSSEPWLDEIYNILYDSPGNLTGAQLEIDSFYGGGSKLSTKHVY